MTLSAHDEAMRKIAPTPVMILGTTQFSEEIGNLVRETDGLDLAGFIENLDPSRCDLQPLGKPVIWIDDLRDVVGTHQFLCGIGTTKRCSYIDQVTKMGGHFATLVHPWAYTAMNANVEGGAVISPCAMIACNAAIGAYTIINRGASIGHHTMIGQCSTIGPGVNIAGRCSIGDKVYIGIGATIVDGLTIGAGAFVRAGALVTSDIPAGGKSQSH